MAKITELPSSIVLENKYVEITLSKKNAFVERIFDKKNNKDIKGEDAYFFSLTDADRKTVILPTALSRKDDILVVDTPKGTLEIQVGAYDNYFTFELISELPKDIFKAEIAETSFVYDFDDKENAGIVGIAMTYWIDPNFFPDGTTSAYSVPEKTTYSKTKGTVYAHLRNKNAKLALIVCPNSEQCGLIKEVCRKIDRKVGLVSEIGGAWARDSRLNFGNYIIEFDTDRAYLDSVLPFYKSIGVNQIDFHQGSCTIRQGDFRFELYENGAEFKKNVSDLLEANGLSAGLHTYSHYIRYDCDAILADPKWQQQLGVIREYTVAEELN